MDEHSVRFNRALLALDGLSVGDAFGERFFMEETEALKRSQDRQLPPPRWRFTDDSIMALAIVRCLRNRHTLQPDELARMFAQDYAADPDRGYGHAAFQILTRIGAGESWKSVSQAVFDGQGSCGNGGAMRVAPLGAYFADDVETLIEQARISAAITHAHPDGQTGAIAVALAAGWIVRNQPTEPGFSMITYVLEHLPKTETHAVLEKALGVPLSSPISEAVAVLGNGSGVTASDTVPFSLWCASRHLNNFTDALWMTVSALGDRDTTCAIVGSLAALSTGLNGIPDEWLDARETLVM